MEKQDYVYEYTNDSEYKYGKQDAINYILGHDYGSTITYAELGKIMGYNVNDELEFERLKNQVIGIREILIDHGYILKTITGLGYYILKPKQISSYVYHSYIRKTARMLGKSDRILQHTDISELTDIRMKEYNEVKELNTEVSDSIDNTIYKSKYEANRHIYDDLND